MAVRVAPAAPVRLRLARSLGSCPVSTARHRHRHRPREPQGRDLRRSHLEPPHSC